jgi:hypothetical protein
MPEPINPGGDVDVDVPGVIARKPLRLEIVPWPKAPDLRKERLMNAPKVSACSVKSSIMRT